MINDIFAIILIKQKG